MKNVSIDENNVKWRVCKVCKQKLRFEEHFALKNGEQTPHWRRTECRDCVRAEAKNKREAKRSASREMPLECECCGRESKKTLCCDHIHGTHTFRGWICQACNKGIGMTIDDPEIGFEKILRYYKSYDSDKFKEMESVMKKIMEE